MPGGEPRNSLRISQLATVPAPVPLTAKIPVVIGGASRVVTLNSLLNSVTGGTVTSISQGTNVKLTPNPITSTGTISFYLPGMIIPYAGSSEPFGWVFCNGLSFPIDGVYSDLFNAIQYRYGGSGSSFKVPDLRGRIPFGKAQNSSASSPLSGSSFDNGTYYNSGSYGGSENHYLTSSQTAVKSHQHTSSGTMTVYGACDDTNCWDDRDCKPPECYDGYNQLGEVGGDGGRASASGNATTNKIGRAHF